MRPIPGTVTDPVALRRALGGEKEEPDLALALRAAQRVNRERVEIIERQKRDFERLGEDLRVERDTVAWLKAENDELLLQLKAFQSAGSAIERAVMKTFDKLRAEIETKDATIRALVAEGD